MRSAQLSLLLGLLAVAVPVTALLGPAPAQLKHNRRLLARWKKDPAHYARLRDDLRWFQALPPERQAALRQLDEQLFADEDPAVRKRLLQVMDRYATWREHLSAADRERIDTAPGSAERLRVIQEIRERQWIERLPRAQREQLDRAPDRKARADLIATLRRQERERRQEWRSGAGPPAWRPPLRVTDLPPAAEAFVDRDLIPLLNADERQRLRRAEGQWPGFGRTLLEMVDRHPAGLPGPVGPTRPGELPKEVLQQLRQIRAPKAQQQLRLHEGLWPDYAIAVTRLVRNRTGAMPHELGPCRPDEFPGPVREFLTRKLLPRLNEKERKNLAAVQGRWPDYPREVMGLARKHNLPIPGLTPPPPAYWDHLRAAAGV